MNVSRYRTIESWINAVLKKSYDDHGHMTYFPDGQFNESNRWGFVLGDYYHMGNLDQSNYDTISEHMLKRYPRESQIICPVFKVSGLWVKLLTKRGKPTQAALHLYDLFYDLECEYPVFDEDDLNQREYDQQLESIENTLGGYLADNVPDDYPRLVFSHLWETNQDAIITEDHAYCDGLSVFLAAFELGFLDDSDPDDFPCPGYILREIDSFIVGAFNKR